MKNLYSLLQMKIATEDDPSFPLTALHCTALQCARLSTLNAIVMFSFLQEEPPPARVHLLLPDPLVLSVARVEGPGLQPAQAQREARAQLLQLFSYSLDT